MAKGKETLQYQQEKIVIRPPRVLVQIIYFCTVWPLGVDTIILVSVALTIFMYVIHV